jgi:DnaK suppressor protein
MTERNGRFHREILLALRARLLGDVNQMADAALKDSNGVRMPSDLADAGTDAYEQELTLDLLGNGKEVLEQIEAALGRIEDGSYSRCEACGKSIANARLDAIPYAALCVKCASQQEGGGPNRKPR